MQWIRDVRNYFASQYTDQNFVIDKTGVRTIEMVGACFLADEPTIFGTVNEDYVRRELDWYKSMSLNVYDIPGGPPKIWEHVSDNDGNINSNYGWCVWSDENHRQYWKVYHELLLNPNSRRAVMIYTRPTMHEDYCTNGMSDFMCTNTVQYLIRDNCLVAVVQMRSNDIWAGYRNDYAWQNHVVKLLAAALGIDETKIVWQVGSLHCYERDFYLIDHYVKTFEISISKKQYEEQNA